MQCCVICTDLDGTLLHHDTYKFDAANPALALLRERGIPVILCSSKTRAEIEYYRSLLQNEHPFVAENGGAAFIPQGYFPPFATRNIRDGYEVLEFGQPYETIVRALEQCRRETGAMLTGFHDLAAEEVVGLTGLSLENARRAKAREYDEPFLLRREEDRSVVETWVRGAGLRISGGGRFYHLTGNHDKGGAVDAVLRQFRHEAPVLAVGIGDSTNDLPMLQAVDRPLLVQRHDGTYDPNINNPKIAHVAGVGPVGWNTAILTLLAAGVT
ncbi:MAG: HAD-IIB family hydrolase [Candidatus Methylomirabilia bacterium]